jgi:tRNA (guanine37-N1)-methyltransferase
MTAEKELKMRFDIMTLFPDMVGNILSESIIGRAQKSGAVEINLYNIRDYSTDKHRRVDDTPYGGGKGMLMMAPPIYNCYSAILEDQKNAGFEPQSRRVIYMSPAGKVLNQKKAEELAASYDNLILLCGHYEGVDRRIVDEIVDEEISIGNYVLTGGEIPACILVDCVARLADGVLSAAECHENESISSGMLECPQYTRPVEFHGVRVPDVLLSGDHKKIDLWRQNAALELTQRLRPDLLEGREVPSEGKKKGNK